MLLAGILFLQRFQDPQQGAAHVAIDPMCPQTKGLEKASGTYELSRSDSTNQEA